MNKLERLIAKLCPNGVEYKALGEIGEFYGGLVGKCKDDFVDGNAKFISYMHVFSNSAVNVECEDRVRISSEERQNIIKYGDVIFTGSSETLDECGMSSVLTVRTNEKLYLNSFCFGYRVFDELMFLPNFLKHLFRSMEVRKQICRTANGVTRFNISKVKMGQVMIPTPPLPVQEEIVRMLDDMAGLIGELEQELAARNQQYEWYRERLVKFTKGYSKIRIEDVCARTMNVQWKGNTKAYRYIDLSSVDREKHVIGGTMEITSQNAPSRAQQIVCVGDVLFATTRPTQMRLCVVPLEYDGQICSTGYVVLRPNIELVNPRWIYYQLCGDEFCHYCEHNQIQGGAYPSIANASVKAYEIIIPPRNVQDEVVRSLDNFLTVVSTLDEEIALRKRQYEYYRDRLLTFPRAD